MPHAAEDVHAIGFNALPAASPVAPLAPLQLDIDQVGFDGHSRREAIDQSHQGLAVRFTGGPIAQHITEPMVQSK